VRIAFSFAQQWAAIGGKTMNTYSEKQACETKTSNQLWTETIKFVRSVLTQSGVQYKDLDDVVQNVCLRILKQEARYGRRDQGLKLAGIYSRGWLATIARTAAIDFYRPINRYQEHGRMLSIVGDKVLSVQEGQEYYLPVPEKEVAELDVMGAIVDSFGCLNRAQQLTMQLHMQDLSYEMIAKLTGVDIGTVRSRIFYSKRKLRKQLIDWK
jgi:RNA polymerase sigma factor (sigma-70 family)